MASPAEGGGEKRDAAASLGSMHIAATDELRFIDHFSGLVGLSGLIPIATCFKIGSTPCKRQGWKNIHSNPLIH